MPILTQDIKLLKSAVMADTTDGGGAMTGVEVIDGQSNNLFPDTSALDRAFGRVNLRKVFGVAQTLDTDTLLGAHAIITDAPDDPLVHCTLIKTPGWADTRDLAKEGIEKYLVKGPKISAKLYDAHYAGSLQVRLITFVGAAFPTAGDAIVLRTPAGVEQYVRILNVTAVRQNVAVSENGNVTVFAADIATCDLGQPLAVDFFGPPAARVFVEASFTQIFSTVDSVGAKFYGIKPLGVAGVPGDLKVTSASGIFTPVVPAATIETAVIDQYPMAPISQLTFTSTTVVSLDASPVTLAPNRAFTFPTAIRPGSVSMVASGLTFTDDSQGNLMQSGAIVGTVDYKAGVATFSSSAPYNSTVSGTASYVPASLVVATNNSVAYPITSTNQGLSFTNAFEPPPAPGSFSLSYMAQGRWYDLTDNANGKLSGAEPSYGIGTLNYATGSMAVTLGAVPDVGSVLIASWGSQAAAEPVAPAALPGRASVSIPLASGIETGGMTLNWENGSTPYTATVGSDGQVAGAATGSIVNGKLIFEPAIFPTGDVLLSYKKSTPVAAPTFTGNAGLYTITSALPVTPGSLGMTVAVEFPFGTIDPAASIDVWDANGLLYTTVGTIRRQVGTINYANGAIGLDTQTNLPGRKTIAVSHGGTGWQATQLNYFAVVTAEILASLGGAVSNFRYAAGAAAVVAQPLVFTPISWTASVSTLGAELGTGSLAFTLGNQKYYVKDGSVVQNWSFGVGGGTTLVAGTVSGSGLLNINAANLPLNRVNSLVFGNASVNNNPGVIRSGVFRLLSAPIKPGVFQLQSRTLVGSANETGVITGGGFTGTVDFQRGVCRWESTTALNPSLVSYNAVLLQYLPLEASLLGLETARLPLDGKVPVFRPGDLLVVHNTLTTALPNPLVKNTTYPLGRVRLASVRVKDALGVEVPDTLYAADLNPGTITVPTAANISAFTQPFKVEHRIEDMVLCSQSDISGALKITRSLTHNFPADTSFISSAMPFGDLFARAYNFIDQTTWTGAWSDTLIGAEPLASYNFSNYPLIMTNRGAIKERWALIFSNNTAFRVIGENSGEVATGSINTVTAPNNPATGVPYFTVPVLGWGGGWSEGNVLRFNTDACGSPFWAVRTTLQGPATLDSDQFSLAFRGDVDRP